MMAKTAADRQPHRLDSLFQPKSIALVGATERSMWSNGAYGNLVRYGYEGDIHLVNPKGGTVYKRDAVKSCAAIGKPVDLALMMVPEAAFDAAFDDMLAAGVRNAVILSAGFAETGAAGIKRQATMAARARAADMRLLGPNCLGFVNYVHKVPVWTNVRRRQRTPGAVAIVSQSGAAANHMGDFAFRQNIPLSLMISTGNESDVDVAVAIEYLITEPHTKAIAVFLETVRDSRAFMRAASAARAAGKPIVVLKVGASDVAAQAAAAHTGALVGDDRVFDAACARFGMVRVTSPERLIFTADLLARLPPVTGRKLAFSSLSGGMCGIGADQATASGLTLPAFSADTVAGLRAVMPAFGAAQNPLDFTGAAVLDPSIMERALGIIARDPEVDMLACLLDAPEGDDATGFLEKALHAMGRGFAASQKPCVVFSNTISPVSKVGREVADAAGVAYSGAGIELGLAALAGAARWWALTDNAVTSGDAAASDGAAVPRNERESLEHLARYGVPVIPAELVTSAGAAAGAAKKFAGPVALKIASAQIQHKSDVGGVVLNVTADKAAAEFDAMVARVRHACPDAVIDGVLVSPMRQGGVELLVGVMRDPVWGPVIAVGLGGVFVELLKDTALRLLPVSVGDVLAMLGELRGQAMLDGFRGGVAVDRKAVADAVVRIGQAALALGPSLAAFEVNPLWVSGAQVEALDALTVMDGGAAVESKA